MKAWNTFLHTANTTSYTVNHGSPTMEEIATVEPATFESNQIPFIMKTLSKLAIISKTAFAAFALLLVSNGLKAQTANITNFSSVEMVVTVYGATTCVAGEYNCEETVVVPAATSSGPGTASVTLSCPSDYVVTADVDENNSSTVGVTLKTPNCLCGQGPQSDSDSFVASNSTTIDVSAECSGQDMAIEIY